MAIRFRFFILLSALGLLSTGCARARFNVVQDPHTILNSHRVIVDVTCVEVAPVYYTRFRDNFSMLAMPPRVRWHATFHLDKVVQGEFDQKAVCVSGVANRKNPFITAGFQFQKGTNYLLGFDRVYGFEIRSFSVVEKK